MRRYFRVWWLMTTYSFQTFFVSRIGAVLFLAGKILRFIFFFGFLLLLLSKTKILAGYNIWEVLLFYLTFNFIESVTQMFFREVYRFRQYIVTGNFDMMLVKPVNILFRSLFGWTDILDFITLGPFILVIGFIMTRIENITFMGVIFYIGLILNSLLITTSFHIFVLGLAVLTTEIDHAIMIYRDLSGMGKIPVDVYSQPLRSFITFVVPVGIMMTFPVKAAIGRLPGPLFISAFLISFIMLSLSLILWRYALRKYTSASS